MNIEVLNSGKSEAAFILKDINPAVANTIRRLVIDKVPTLAIEEMTITKNESPLYDEAIAHRMGLIPLKTDLKYYEKADECKCKGEGCSKCRVNFTLKVTGPATVYAESIEFDDPKVKATEPKTPIVILLKNQKIELTGYAILSAGEDHAKFSPAHIYYRGVPQLEAGKANTKKVVEACDGVIKEKGKGLEITDLTKWNEHYGEVCEQNGVEIKSSDKDFVFFVESWGQLDIQELLNTAIDEFDAKLNEFEEAFKKAK